MTPSQGFAELMVNTNMVTVCLWITGLILFCVEFFQPMHGIFYALGGGLLVAAFVTRTVYGTPSVGFMFIFVTAIILFCVHVVVLATQKRDWLAASRIERAGERRRKYGNLIDYIGVANTPIDLTGNVTINDINLVVYSETPIGAGEHVRIVKITNDKIVVERVDRDIEMLNL